MKNLYLLVLIPLLLPGCKPPAQVGTPTPTPPPVSSGPVWHVAGDGDDKNDGRTEATAFRSLAKAAAVVQPGDTVLIGNGIYTDKDNPGQQSLVTLATSGKPDAWITWRARPGHQPELRPWGWAGISITSSYHVIDGLTVIGPNDSLTLLGAIEDAKKPKPDGRFNTNGIVVEGRKNSPEAKPHHVVIRNCTVGKCGGGGITALEADYITIEDNRVYENAWFMRYAGSGITFLNNWAFDDAPGYHVVIQRNRVWDNKTLVPWERTGKLSDGNGILLDVTDQEGDGALNPDADAAVTSKPAASGTAAPQVAATTPAASQKPQRPEWKGRALIANNVSAFNGGSGIHTFRTKHVDIINNTTYWNGGSVGYQELFANRSEDIVILNNVIVPRPAGKVTSNNRNTNVRWDYNLYAVGQEFNSKPNDIVKGPNDIVGDPKFVKIARDLREADFRLAEGSPARDSGTDAVPQATDLTGTKRPVGKGRDRGAFEQ